MRALLWLLRHSKCTIIGPQTDLGRAGSIEQGDMTNVGLRFMDFVARSLQGKADWLQIEWFLKELWDNEGLMR